MSYGVASSRLKTSYGLKLPWSKTYSGMKLSEQSTRNEIIEALRHCPSLSRDDIEVRVRDGEVILSGSVASWVNRTLAADAAWSVEGVEDVTNLLQVKTI